MMAALYSTIALSIDAMLPALPEIAASLSPDAPNRAQLVVTSYVLGLGLGTVLMGPLSDSFGRKPVILGGAAVFIIGALASAASVGLEALLIARMVQGFGAAAARVVGTALVRDLYAGRAMAQVMSLVMTIFTLVPAAAPFVGQQVINFTGWRGIFLFFAVFNAATALWVMLAQSETLQRSARRPWAIGAIWAALREVMGQATVIRVIVAQSMILGALFAMLSSIQGIFAQYFGRADSFPAWFAVIALVSIIGPLLNARFVQRFGMRVMVKVTLYSMGILSAAYGGSLLIGLLESFANFGGFLLWSMCLFAVISLTMGNLNTIAMEPLGHIAGMAASCLSALSTVGAVMIAVPIGLAFNGTPLPLIISVAGLMIAALLALRPVLRG
jgi:DHA1 family bicyclomycin/chloramphenicol resistance-like MFS transporter